MAAIPSTRDESTQPARHPGAGRRGRTRSAEIDRAILDAALDLLAEVGYERFTVSEVIARVGVSSATLYRRWPTQHDLMEAAVRSMAPESIDVDAGSLRGDLSDFLEALGSALERRQHLAEAGRVGIRNPALASLVETTFLRPLQEAFEHILERARGRGELGDLPAIEDAWSFVVGPLHHRIFVRREPFSPAFLEATLAFAVPGLRALCGHEAQPKTRKPAAARRRSGSRSPAPSRRRREALS